MSRGQSAVASILLISVVTITLVFERPSFPGFVYLFFAVVLGFVAVNGAWLSTVAVGSVALSMLMRWVSSDSARPRALMLVAWILWVIGFLNSGPAILLPSSLTYGIVLLTVLIHWYCLIDLLLTTRKKPQVALAAEVSALSVTEVFAALSAAGLLILLSLSFFLLQHLRSGGERFEQIQPPNLGLLFVTFLSGMLALAVHLTERSSIGLVRGWATWGMLIVTVAGVAEYFGVRDWYRYALSSLCVGIVFFSVGRLLQSAPRDNVPYLFPKPTTTTK